MQPEIIWIKRPNKLEFPETLPSGVAHNPKGAVVKSGLSRCPVKAESAGSNPVGSATKREDCGYEYMGTCIGTK